MRSKHAKHPNGGGGELLARVSFQGSTLQRGKLRSARRRKGLSKVTKWDEPE